MSERRIKQGDVFWVPLPEAEEPGSGIVHPHVVIQDDLINASRCKTVVVCGLSSNRKRAGEPGNVQLEAGEANLSRLSFVVVSEISTVTKVSLGEYIGRLSPERVAQIFDGMRFLQSFTEQR